MHTHKLYDGTVEQCDGVFWDGSAWRVCLKEHLLHKYVDGLRDLEPIEKQFHGGEEGCRTALKAWKENQC